MVRTVLYLLAGIFLIAVVRMIIGTLGKAFTAATMGQSEPSQSSAKSAPGGELKKCVVCGTYSPVATAPKVQGVLVFLCSEACAQKYRS